jgi:glycosyltransferase involved in cell wall biosynthesis
MTPGYMQSVADKYCDNPQIEFAGYVAEQKIPELFRGMSLLLMPYSSSTGSSGVAHQAAQYGIPIVCADIHDFREMAEYERLAIEFYPVDDRDAFAQTVANLLNSPDRLANMAMKNYQAALGMTLPCVVQNHLRLFPKSAVGRNNRLADAPAWNSSADDVIASDGKSAA